MPNDLYIPFVIEDIDKLLETLTSLQATDTALNTSVASEAMTRAAADAALAAAVASKLTQTQANALYRPIAYAPVPFFTVAADGSGDYTTIAVAITAAPVGATIVVKRGTYSPVATLAPKANQTIRGEGKGATIINAPVGGGLNAFRLDSAGVTIEKLAINGQKALQPDVQSNSAYQGIRVTAANCTVRDVRIFGTRNHAIWVQLGGDNFTLRDSSIENESITTAVPGWSYYGVQLYGAVKNGLIKNNRITGWAQGVGLWYGVQDTVVEGNNIIDNYGFLDAAHTQTRSACEDFGGLEPGHERNKWINNIVDGSTSHCLEIAQGVHGSEFIGNTLRNPAGKFWEITGQMGQETTDILIQGNDIKSGATTRNCAVVGLVHRVMITQNKHDKASIVVGGAPGATDISIHANNLRNVDYAVWINDVAAPCSVTYNTINAASVWGIYVISGSSHDISHNRIRSTTAGGGIAITANAGVAQRIKENFISTFGTPINCQQSQCQIESNDVKGTGSAAVAGIFSIGNRTQILRNFIRQAVGTERDIWVSGVSNNVKVRENGLTYNTILDNSGGVGNVIVDNYVL